MLSGKLVHTAVHAIYTAALVPEQWPKALDAIADCFDGIGTALLLNWSSGSVSTIVSPALAAAAKDYETWAWKLDFYVPRAYEASVITPYACYSDRHLAKPDEIRKHPFYTQFRAKHGLGPFLGTQLLPHSAIVSIMTVQGRATRNTFTDEEIEVYSIIARHAERALMLAARLLEAESRSEALADALSRMACGVFALDELGKVVFTNVAAERMICGPLKVADGRLTIDGPDWIRLQNALQDTKSLTRDGMQSAKPSKPVVLACASAVERLVLYVLPIGEELPWGIRETFTTARVLVLAIQQPVGRADPALVRDVLGLTQGEARVAALIGEGKSPKDAANTLGITEESARTVLKRVFAKTNTTRQSELAAMLARIVMRSEP